MKHIVKAVFALLSIATLNAQKNLSATYINLPPLIATSIEVGQEYSFKKNRAFDIAGGIVINSNHLKQYHKAGTSYEISQRSGLYLKVSKKFIARKFEDKLGPYFGVFVSNGLGFEKGIYQPYNPYPTPGEGEKASKLSYISGLGISLGINPPQNTPLGIEPGIQAGISPFNNQLEGFKYTPGLGRNFMGFYLQGILKFRFHRVPD
ncbi:hypothetical protein [uncultured Arcticibacterium sp.]|uniref:hypothetical protein n=1 Tax=uncultured Arcticibacterium sp. TaxID=2173042 RepID=UPI0030FC6FA8